MSSDIALITPSAIVMEKDPVEPKSIRRALSLTEYDKLS